jgi:hypothetical protein
MYKLILLVCVALLVVTPMCTWLGDECSLDRDCDDGNECTNDVCKVRDLAAASYPDYSCADQTHERYCAHSEVDDGSPCDAAGEPGMCTSGECQPSGEASEPIVDGGVGDVGVFEVQP